MSFKVRVIGDEEVRTSERGWSGCDERISKKPSEKNVFLTTKSTKKKSIYKTSGVCVRNSASGKDD